MKKFIATILLIYSSFAVFSQDRELEINYIFHDHFNGSLLDAMEKLYGNAAYNPNKTTYIYMANAMDPIILKCTEDSQKEFEDFCYALNSQIKHNAFIDVDIENILRLLNEDDFEDSDGNPTYDYFTLNFYITPSFITEGYNESLVARLFWDLELASKKNTQITLYHPADDGVEYDMEHLFGPKKLNGDYEVYMITF